jgi:hypothetical protein
MVARKAFALMLRVVRLIAYSTRPKTSVREQRCFSSLVPMAGSKGQAMAFTRMSQMSSRRKA